MIDLKRLYESMPPDLQRKVSCHDLKQTVDKYNGEQPPLGSLIEWYKNPENPRVFFGCSRLMPGTTIYIIELCEDRDDRGNMSGAFISDEMEKEGLFQRSLLNWLKWTAENLMLDFVKAHAVWGLDAEEAKLFETEGTKRIDRLRAILETDFERVVSTPETGRATAGNTPSGGGIGGSNPPALAVTPWDCCAAEVEATLQNWPTQPQSSLASESQREAAGTADEKPDGQAENDRHLAAAPQKPENQQ